MADAAVLTPAQLAAVMAGRPLSSVDGAEASATTAQPPAGSAGPAGPSGSGSGLDTPMAALACSATLSPFYTGSATGNGTGVLPLLYPASMGPAAALLFTALDDTVALTLSTTGQTVARITHRGLASPAELAEEDPDTPLGDGDAVQTLALAESKWPPPRPAREQEEEGEEAALLASTTLVVATQARFLRTYAVRVYARGASVDVRVVLVRTTAKAHEAPILVMRTSAELATCVRAWGEKYAGAQNGSPNTLPVNLLATGSADGMVKVWDVAGGYVTHVLRGHGGPVSALYFFVQLPRHAPAGERRLELVTGAVDGRVRVWDLLQAAEGENGSKSKKKKSSRSELQQDTARGAVQQKPAAMLELHDSVVRGLSMSDDGSQLVTSSRDTTIGLWTRQLHRSSQDKSFKNLDLPAEGSTSTAAWKQKEVIDCSEGIESVGFLPAPARFVPRGESASAGAKNEEQDLFYSAGSKGLLRLWSFSRGQVVVVAPSLGPAPKEGDDDVHAVQQVHLIPPFSGPGSDPRPELGQVVTLVTVQMDQTFAVRTCPTLVHQGSTAAPTPVAERPLHLAQLLVGTEDQLADVALVNPAGSKTSTHIALATNVPEVHVARLPPPMGAARRHRAQYASTALLAGHTGMVLALASSSNGQWLATASRDRTVRVWACARPSERDSGLDAAQGWRCLAVASGHTESVGAIRFAPRPSAATGLPPFLVSASSDRTLKVWDLSPLAALAVEEVTEPVRLASLTTLKVHERDVNAVDVAPDNGLILTGSQDRTARLFQLTFTPATHKKKGTNRPASASLLPVATVKGHKRGVWSVRFSPSDRAFATGGGDRVARLWALPPPSALGANALAGSGGAAGQGQVQCVRTFEGHSAAVLRVEFAARGTQLLTSSSDGLVKLWSVKDESCLWTGDAHYTSVFGLAVLPPTPADAPAGDETAEDAEEDAGNAVTRVVSVGADARVRVWDDVTLQRKEEEQRKRVEQVEQEQEFETRLAAHDWSGAIKLALERNHPRRLLELFTHVAGLRPRLPKETGAGAESAAAGALLASMLGKALLPGTEGRPTTTEEKDALSITGQAAVDGVLAQLGPAEAARLLHHVRDWNTAARTAGVAQTVLHALLRLHSARWLLDALDAPAPAPRTASAAARAAPANGDDKFALRMDASALLAALRPYTERHYARSDRLMTEAAVLDYTLHALDAVAGLSDSEDEEPDEEPDEGRGEEQEAADVAMADRGSGSESESEAEAEAEAMSMST